MHGSAFTLIALLALSSTGLGQSASSVASGLQSAARNIPNSCGSTCKSWLSTLSDCPTSASSSSEVKSFEKCVCTSSFLSQSDTCFACFKKAGSSQSSLQSNLDSICGDSSSSGSSSSSKGSSSSGATAAAPVNNNAAGAAQPTTVIAGSQTIVLGVETGGKTVTAFEVAQQTQVAAAAASSGAAVNNAAKTSAAGSLVSSKGLLSLAGMVAVAVGGSILA